MDNPSSRLIEKYRAIFKKDPRSKVFATLADAYRKVDLIEEAEKICKQGLKFHPQFVPGRVVMAKILLQKKLYDPALVHLEDAVKLDPENILAHSLRAETLLRLKRPKEALQAYKMVLFFNPFDPKASHVVKKLESLTAEDYEDDLFEIQSLDSATEVMPTVTEFADREILPPVKPRQHVPENQELVEESPEPTPKSFILDRYLSLFDAFLVRSDLDKAEATIKEALANLGNDPEIKKRLSMLENKVEDSSGSKAKAANWASMHQKHSEKEKIVLVDEAEVERERKIAYLQELLARIHRNKMRIEA